MQQKIGIVRELYNAEYERMSAKYAFERPYLKLIKELSGLKGCYVHQGFAYSKDRPVVRINICECYDAESIRRTIVHEFCHAIMRQTFEYRGKPSHNKRFWELCKEFGLGALDYFKVTQEMRKVWSEEEISEEIAARKPKMAAA